MEIITVMDNIDFNKILKNKFKNNKEMIIHEDISYIDGISEILNVNKNVDLIIINSMITDKETLLNTISKIYKIKKIPIIIFLEKEDIEFRKLLVSFGITHIFLNNQININELIDIINNDEEMKKIELEEEIRALKEKLFLSENSQKENDSNFLTYNKKGLKNSRIFKTILSFKNREVINLNNRKYNQNEYTMSENVEKYNSNNSEISVVNSIQKIKNKNKNLARYRDFSNEGIIFEQDKNKISFNVQNMLKNIKEITLTLDE